MARARPAAAISAVETPTIGAGEGSTPQQRGFFNTLGVVESDWMPACDATDRAGIAFHGWPREPGFAPYLHPFAGAVDLHTRGGGTPARWGGARATPLKRIPTASSWPWFPAQPQDVMLIGAALLAAAVWEMRMLRRDA